MMFEGGEKRQKTLNKSRNTTFVMNVYLVLILKSKKNGSHIENRFDCILYCIVLAIEVAVCVRTQIQFDLNGKRQH